MTYPGNPFPEALEVAEFLRLRTDPEDRILVLGSEAEILFYAGRQSVTKHVYMYDLMYETETAARIQDEVIAAAERERPRYIVLVNVALSWLRRENSSLKILEWFERYRQGYELEAVWDLLPAGTRRVTGEDLRRYRPVSQSRISVWRRREAP